VRLRWAGSVPEADFKADMRIILAQLSEGALLQDERAMFPHGRLELQCARVGLHKFCTSINTRALLAANSRRAQGVLNARPRPRWVRSRRGFQRAAGVRELFIHARRTGRICLFRANQRARRLPGQRAHARALLPAHFQLTHSPPHARMTREFIYATGNFLPVCE